MSGKPATPPASRVALPGAPRLLVYVADPRQLEPGAPRHVRQLEDAGPASYTCQQLQAVDPVASLRPDEDSVTHFPYDSLQDKQNLQRNNVYKGSLDRREPIVSGNLLPMYQYKSFNESVERVCGVYGVTENSVTPRSEYFSVDQPFVRDRNFKLEDKSCSDRSTIALKRDSVHSASSGQVSIDAYSHRVTSDTIDLSSHQMRCTPLAPDHIPDSIVINSAVPGRALSLNRSVVDHREVINTVIHGEGTGEPDEVSGSETEKESQHYNGGVNYQFLERSISHQSILNQSISILNQQVVASRLHSGPGDGEATAGAGPQLVRTAEGVVLAVLPVEAEPTCAEVSASKTVRQPDVPQTVTVPLGWKRIVSGSSVLYISPSGAALGAFQQLREYLQTAGTCKCGLPCPLRPEAAFSFDPKVPSKPYEVPAGGDLTKLCNHKRKLLASLRVPPATPPPHPTHPTHPTPPCHDAQRKAPGAEVLIKKKMKKRSGASGGLAPSAQLGQQRERAPRDYKAQQQEHCREVANHDSSRANSPLLVPAWISSNSCPPFTTSPSQQNLVSNSILSNRDTGEGVYKQDFQMHRNVTGSHFLTVNSGCINQSTALNAGYRSQQVYSNHLIGTTMAAGGHQINIGQPVLGTNGQIIGVHTGIPKQESSNFRNNLGGMHHQVAQPAITSKEEERKSVHESGQGSGQIMMRQSRRDDEVAMNMFCGVNQPPLTPEVMQKINQQQQIFIQQNQKQIEMAMKGIKTQVNSGRASPAQNKLQSQTQTAPQGQLVIQNGTVMKGNPGKTPPWQVKKSDMGATTAAYEQRRIQNNAMDCEEQTISLVEDSQSSMNSNDQTANQAMYSRVPPLPQHYSIMAQWATAETQKKKVKNPNKVAKKKGNNVDTKNLPFGTNGMRISQETKSKPSDEGINNNPVLSFMDDPSGYLAQQTVLLNNTISKQVGINSPYEHNPFTNTNVNNSFSSNTQLEKSYKSKSYEENTYIRNNINQNISLLQNSSPDSSVLSEKGMENRGSHCCKGCPGPVKITGNENYSDNLIRRSYVKQQVYQSKIDMEAYSNTSSPKHSLEDSPVTSSTFLDRSQSHSLLTDNRGPIQGGTISTSNVSPVETLQLPEPSPTPSNSSRNTDTPHSNNSGSVNITSNCAFPVPSPVYSNPGSCRENYNSSPSTPTPGNMQYCAYSSPGPPTSQNLQSVTGSQMMNFISNHNVNRNLMDVENISFPGGTPVIKGSSDDTYKNEIKKNIQSNQMMPGYCAPPHLGGGPGFSVMQSNYPQGIITTMASGHSVIRDTITSVLAGKAQTATTSMNASSANFLRQHSHVNLANSYAIPPNHPDPFLNSLNLPTSYPLHIAGTVAQNMISKTPLEMVQNVVSSIPLSRTENSTVHSQVVSQGPSKFSCQNLTPGQILISSTGQILLPNQGNTMPPPAPKMQTGSAVSPGHASAMVSNGSGSLTQVLPSGGGVQQMVNQPTVLVNAMSTPFLLQPQMMTVDGQVVSQNTVLPQIVTGGLVPPGQSSNEGLHHIDPKTGHAFMHKMAMLSPEGVKKKSKKRKGQTANLTNVLHIAAPQANSGSIMVHHTSPHQHSNSQFSPRSFQLSPNNNLSPGPMLQALTIVPGKSGTPAHIVMNGQGGTNNFSSQQIITNTSPTQQINLLQPVNLINNTGGVVPNFPTFQQFLVPNLGSMVMTADGTAIIQDSSTGMPMQLQLQTVNGQNVLTPVQNSSLLTAGGNTGVVIRTQNQHGKIIQSQHSPGAQFLSPNSHIMMNSPTFNGQLSPLIANLSPTNVTYNTTQQVRSANVQPQDLIQCNQMGQTLMVPLSPKSIAITSATGNRNNSTFVQQNTTIVQQQTTLVSNTSNNQLSALTPNVHGGGSRLSIDPNILFNNAHKQISNHLKGRNFIEIHSEENHPSPPVNSHFEDLPRGSKSKIAYSQMGQAEASRDYEHCEDDRNKFVNMSNHGYPFNVNASSGFNQVVMNHSQQGGMAYSAHVRHSVSTQTLLNQQQNAKSPPVQAYSQQVSGSSPPDTTTHSPLGPLDSTSSSPRLGGSRSVSIQGNYADTTTKTPEPMDQNSSAMVQCVSSSEPDIAELRDNSWQVPNSDFSSESDSQGLMSSNVQILRNNRNVYCGVESSDCQYNQTISVTSVNNQQSITITPTNYYDRLQTNKRKNEFENRSGDGFRADKIMRTSFHMVHEVSNDMEYDSDVKGNSPLKVPKSVSRQYTPSGSRSNDNPNMQKMYDRHNVGAGNETKAEDTSPATEGATEISSKCEEPRAPSMQLSPGDLVWGPAKGYPSWPGKLVSLEASGECVVRWFGGDKLLSLVAPARLQTLSEGLEAHHAARTKCRKSRKLNSLLENAIQEAMSELDKLSDVTAKACDIDSTDGCDPDILASVSTAITETPRKYGKRHASDKSAMKTKSGSVEKLSGHRKMNPVKIAPNPNTTKVGDGSSRLRSSR